MPDMTPILLENFNDKCVIFNVTVDNDGEPIYVPTNLSKLRITEDTDDIRKDAEKRVLKQKRTIVGYVEATVADRPFATAEEYVAGTNYTVKPEDYVCIGEEIADESPMNVVQFGEYKSNHILHKIRTAVLKKNFSGANFVFEITTDA